MAQASHLETHWFGVLSLDHICSIAQILHFDVSKSAYSYFMFEGLELRRGKGMTQARIEMWTPIWLTPEPMLLVAQLSHRPDFGMH